MRITNPQKQCKRLAFMSKVQKFFKIHFYTYIFICWFCVLTSWPSFHKHPCTGRCYKQVNNCPLVQHFHWCLSNYMLPDQHVKEPCDADICISPGQNKDRGVVFVVLFPSPLIPSVHFYHSNMGSSDNSSSHRCCLDIQTKKDAA